jgi:hypothetical protein
MAIATDTSEVPHVVVAAQNLELVAADEFSPKEEKSSAWIVVTNTVLTSVLAVVVIRSYFSRRRTTDLMSAQLELMRKMDLEMQTEMEKMDRIATTPPPDDVR